MILEIWEQNMKHTALFYSPASIFKPALVIGAIVVAMLIASAHTGLRDRSKGGPSSLEASATANPQDPVVRLEAEVIIIGPNGFEPSEITRPAGPVIIAIHNRTGLATLALRLELMTGTPQLPIITNVRNVVLRRQKADLDEVIELPPGNYRIAEADHPDWILRLKHHAAHNALNCIRLLADVQ